MSLRLTVLLLLLVSLLSLPASAHAQTLGYGQFDSWVWAQTVLLHPEISSGAQLDPDDNGIACDEFRSVPGFAPAFWAESIPTDAVAAELTSVTDGDTLDVLVNGVPETVRLYRTDTPETYDFAQCGGEEARQQTAFLLRLNGSTVYLQQDETLRDPYNRYFAYVWLMIDDHPYLLNEALIRSGWGADVNYGGNKYDSQLIEAARFAKSYQLGAWQICPQGPNPPDEPPSNPAPSAQLTSCDPSYSTVCIPPVSEVGDLDCDQIPHRRFQVMPPDPHGFDREGDGVGCESYQ